MKQTEIGLIPDDWEVKEFNQVATLINGRAYSQSELLKQGKYKVLRVGNFGTNDTWYYSNLELPEKQYCNKGDLLYCWSCTYGAYIWNEDDTIYHYHIWKIQTNNADKYYLKYILNNDIASQMSNSNGSTMAHITKGFLEKRRFVFPLFEEQQRIAKALSDVDALIFTTEKLLQKKRNIKQGTMQELLTGKKRLPGFSKSNNTKMTELGEIPEDWEVKSLGEIAETFTGLTYSPENVYEHGTLVLRSSNIKNEQLCFEDNVFVQMPIPERAFVKENDILICVRNGSKALIGKSALIPKSAVGMAFGAFMTVLRSTSVNQNYLLYVWQSDFVQNQVTDNLGATINQITNADFKKFNVIISPNRQEQTAIANVLSSMDKEIETLNTKLEKYRNLKTAMMQQLLTGKIRLK